jgi:Ca-activated chloride channel family protein
MEGQAESARDAARHLLSWLDGATDESAVFAFDTHFEELTPFSAGMRELPTHLATMQPFGATSLHDAIAHTARQLDGREGRRRAVVVFTDGNDNSSRLTPSEVSGIASAIDVPVYVVGVVSAIDDPNADIGATGGRSAFEGPLFNLAVWTGGNVFVASSPGERSRVAQRIVEELRYQYLIAFESSGTPGWHPLVVRVRDENHVIRARGGYIAGQSSPVLQ